MICLSLFFHIIYPRLFSFLRHSSFLWFEASYFYSDFSSMMDYKNLVCRLLDFYCYRGAWNTTVFWILNKRDKLSIYALLHFFLWGGDWNSEVPPDLSMPAIALWQCSQPHWPCPLRGLINLPDIWKENLSRWMLFGRIFLIHHKPFWSFCAKNC